MTDTRTREDLIAEIERLEARTVAQEVQMSNLDDKIEELTDKLEEISDPLDAIETFLDECDRPVGSFRFVIPDKPSVHRAVLGLYDAIGRKI